MSVQPEASQFSAAAQAALCGAPDRHPSPAIGFLIAAAFGVITWAAIAVFLI